MSAAKHPRDRSADGGRYETLVKVAAGGMGSVYVARARGALGFEQLVAIKHPHEHLLETKGFKKALLAEARVASKIRHANVVAIRDVDIDGDVISLVMDYVEGASLSDLTEEVSRLPIGTAMRIALDSCAGLHAAHEAIGDDGLPLGVVHRDVSPQNILVGTDGVARITDFGIAKCVSQARDETTQGVLKGKLSYMAPDQIDGAAVDRRADVFAMGVILWELLTGERLFKGNSDAETIGRILKMKAKPPSVFRPEVPSALDAVVLKALEKKRDDRFATAEELGEAIERLGRELLATHRHVGAWVRELVGPMLAEREAAIRAARAGDQPVDLTRVMASSTSTHSGVQVNEAVAARALTQLEAAATVVATVEDLGIDLVPTTMSPPPAPPPLRGAGAMGAAPTALTYETAQDRAGAAQSSELAREEPFVRARTPREPEARSPVGLGFAIAAACVAISIGVSAALVMNANEPTVAAKSPEPVASAAVAAPSSAASASSEATASSAAPPTSAPTSATNATNATSATSATRVPLVRPARPTGGRGDPPAPGTGRVKAPPNPYQ